MAGTRAGAEGPGARERNVRAHLSPSADWSSSAEGPRWLDKGKKNMRVCQHGKI